jgi:UPF0271 protein
MDINVDLGESFGRWQLGDDGAVMPLVQAINVACGFHAGDPMTMMRTVELAREHGVAVGAHPGFPDLLGFGRRPLRLTPAEGRAYVVYQVGALREVLRTHGLDLHHVKMHGAFDDALAEDAALAEAVADAIAAMGISLVYRAYLPQHDPFASALRARAVQVALELYPDLDYSDTGMPQPIRTVGPRAASEIGAQVQSYLDTGCVLSINRQPVRMEATSICLHGDGPHTLEVVQLVRQTLLASGVQLRAAEARDRSTTDEWKGERGCIDRP